MGLVLAEFPVSAFKMVPCCWVLTSEGTEELTSCLTPLFKSLISEPSWLNHFLKAPPLHPISLANIFPHMNFGGHIQTTAPLEFVSLPQRAWRKIFNLMVSNFSSIWVNPKYICSQSSPYSFHLSPRPPLYINNLHTL